MFGYQHNLHNIFFYILKKTESHTDVGTILGWVNNDIMTFPFWIHLVGLHHVDGRFYNACGDIRSSQPYVNPTHTQVNADTIKYYREALPFNIFTHLFINDPEDLVISQFLE